MAVFSFGFVSCGDEADDVEVKTMQITNGSGLTLYSFTVVLGDVVGNVMSTEERGDLYPGDKTAVRVPVGASQFYMAYRDKEKCTWLYSPVYKVGYKTFKLDTYSVSQWSGKEGDDEGDSEEGKDDVEENSMKITNGSDKTLYNFTVIFGDVNCNVMCTVERGDLYPGDKTIVKVPVGAYEFYMAYYDKKGAWLSSPVYNVGYKTFTLDSYSISQWSEDGEYVNAVAAYAEVEYSVVLSDDIVKYYDIQVEYVGLKEKAMTEQMTGKTWSNRRGSSDKLPATFGYKFNFSAKCELPAKITLGYKPSVTVKVFNKDGKLLRSKKLSLKPIEFAGLDTSLYSPDEGLKDVHFSYTVPADGTLRDVTG